MKSAFLLCLSLPLVVLSCSDSETDSPAGSAGSSGNTSTAGTGGMGDGGTGGSTGGAGGMDTNGTAGSGVGGNAAGGAGGMAMGGAGGLVNGANADAGTNADAGADAGTSQVDDGTMTFFVTSTGMGDGGNLDGLTGADAFCRQLAVAEDASFGRRTWRAYLSTSTVNAIDRIGAGPWRNAANVIVANSSAQLHDATNAAAGGPLDATWAINDFAIPLDETGAQVPQNQHDILTGTLLDGTVAGDLTCANWTSNADDDNINAHVGHTNRTGLNGQRQLWHDVHDVGCSQNGGNNVTQGGGRGSFYCFAVIDGQ